MDEKTLILNGSNYSEEHEWWELCEGITDAMFKCLDFISEDEFYHFGHWYVTVNNFGWRDQNGYRIVRAEEGKVLLQEILPNTHCTFWLHKDGEYNLKLRNAHHDSPTGNENYCISPFFETEILFFILFGNGDVRVFTEWDEHGIDRYLADGDNGLDWSNIEDKPTEVLAELFTDSGPTWNGYDIRVEEKEGNVVFDLSDYPFLPLNEYVYNGSAKEVCKALVKGHEIYLERG